MHPPRTAYRGDPQLSLHVHQCVECGRHQHVIIRHIGHHGSVLLPEQRRHLGVLAGLVPDQEEIGAVKRICAVVQLGEPVVVVLQRARKVLDTGQLGACRPI